MRQSTSLLQDLYEKLQAATEELTGINNDERLLEWPVTEAPDLPRLIKLIEPYHRLWHVAYKFHQNHDVWYHGNVSFGNFLWKGLPFSSKARSNHWTHTL